MWDKSSHSFARWALASLALGLAACTGGGGADHAVPESTGTTTTAPATTAAPATIDLDHPIPGGSLHGTPRPPLENTGDDYVAITRSLLGNFRWITENPSVPLLADVFAPGTPPHDNRVEAYTLLTAQGYRWADDGYRVADVQLIDVANDVASLRVDEELNYERVVDSAGNQVGDVRRKEGSSTLNILIARSDGRWRIAAATQLENPEVEL